MCHGIRTALDTLYIREPYTVAHGRESIYHGTALIISLALSFGGVRTHVSFLISAAISVSNDRPYKLERLLSGVRETPPPREEEGRREGRRQLRLSLPSSISPRYRGAVYSLSTDKLRIEFEGDTIFQTEAGERSRSSDDILIRGDKGRRRGEAVVLIKSNLHRIIIAIERKLIPLSISIQRETRVD